MALRVVDRTGGSKWAQAQPACSKWVLAQPAGSKWESALPTVNPQEAPADSQTSAALIYGG